MAPSRLLALAALTLVLIVPSCSSDETCLLCPGGGPIPSSLYARIWPHEDGRYWVYDYVESASDWDVVIYPTAEAVPPLPSFAALAGALSHPEIPGSSATGRGIYRLEFDGSITTESGVTAQHLKAELLSGGNRGAKGPGSFEAAVMTRVWLARPDLRGRLLPILNRMGASPPPPIRSNGRDAIGPVSGGTDFEPILLHDAAWERTKDWIGAYGDLSTRVAWKFLEANLAKGHEFTLQLIPELADDIFLHGKILATGQTVRTPSGAFQNVVRCGYIIDYGLSIATDETGAELGYMAWYDYGAVSYAPTVGPIQSYEVALADRGDPGHDGLARSKLDLLGTHVP